MIHVQYFLSIYSTVCVHVVLPVVNVLRYSCPPNHHQKQPHPSIHPSSIYSPTHPPSIPPRCKKLVLGQDYTHLQSCSRYITLHYITCTCRVHVSVARPLPYCTVISKFEEPVTFHRIQVSKFAFAFLAESLPHIPPRHPTHIPVSTPFQ